MTNQTRSGFSLIEVLVALVMIATTVPVMQSFMIYTFRLLESNKATVEGVSWVENKYEEIIGMPCQVFGGEVSNGRLGSIRWMVDTGNTVYIDRYNVASTGNAVESGQPGAAGPNNHDSYVGHRWCRGI